MKVGDKVKYTPANGELGYDSGAEYDAVVTKVHVSMGPDGKNSADVECLDLTVTTPTGKVFHTASAIKAGCRDKAPGSPGTWKATAEPTP